MTVLPGYFPASVTYDGTNYSVTLNVGSGGVLDTTSGIAGRMTYTQSIALPVTAVANTDFVMSVPVGCILHSMSVYTTVAYTAVTDCKIQVGNAAAGAQYVAAVSVAAIGIVPLTLLAAQTPAFALMPAAPNLFIRLVQSGGSTAVGNGILRVTYST
jgi:hypothetical protein